MTPTALVTGAGSGLGRGFALALARRGYHLLLAGRDESRLRAVAGEIEPVSTASIYRVDLGERVARAEFIDAILAQGQAPRLLVNNAAVMPAGDFMQRSPAELQAAFAVNLLAPAELTLRLCAAPSPPQGVIFVLSTAARFPQPYNSLYCASKSGLRALAETLQVEFTGKTRICLAYPPLTATPMTENLNAGRWPVSKADPLVVAERIVAAYESGQDEVAWFNWEMLPSLLYRYAPRLLRWILKGQRGALQAVFNRSKPRQG